MSQEIEDLKTLIKNLTILVEEQNKKIHELEQKLKEPNSQSNRPNKPLSDLIAQSTELSDDLKEKIDKVADLVLKYGKTISYLQ